MFHASAGVLGRVAAVSRRHVVPVQWQGLAWCSTDASVAGNGDFPEPDPEDMLPSDDFLAGGAGSSAIGKAPYRKSEDRARRPSRGRKGGSTSNADHAFQRWRREEARYA